MAVPLKKRSSTTLTRRVPGQGRSPFEPGKGVANSLPHFSPAQRREIQGLLVDLERAFAALPKHPSFCWAPTLLRLLDLVIQGEVGVI